MSGQASRSRPGPSAPARRGFTTLSGTLGQLAAATHAGLLQALAAEPDAAALAALLRALGALVAAAPYPRLPPDLLPRAVQARTARGLCRGVVTQHDRCRMKAGVCSVPAVCVIV